MISHFFIRRPIFATVVSIIIMLAGVVSITALPVEQYPQITPPIVMVSGMYPGADAETVQNSVVSPLEKQINGVDDMIYMESSSSSDGSFTISVSFEVGTDPDQAMINVNNRVQMANSQLPEEVRRQGLSVRKRSTNIVLIFSIMSDERFDPIFVNNYADLNVVDEIKRVPGVGDVTIFGQKTYSMRVWVNPNKLTQMGLTTSDVAAAVSEQNMQLSLGGVGQAPMTDPVEMSYTVTARGRLTEVSEFENIIIRSNPDGSSLRIKDVARVELGSETYSTEGALNARPSTTIAIFSQPGANVVQVANDLYVALDTVASRFPDGISYEISLDTTKFVRISIQEVIQTLVEAFVLVFIVVFIFLHNWRATLIPLLAVPVSLVGTFAGLYLFGFSINTLTLFAMVLAIGIVVDDAIVVLENIERILAEEEGTVRDAAFKAMSEVTGPVIAIVLVLSSVFIPVAFLGGLSGQLYKQFAVTIAFSVFLSGIVALSLTPALCVLILKPDHHGKKHGFFHWFDEKFDQFAHFFVKLVDFTLRRAIVMTALFLLVIVATVYLFRTVPSGLVPNEDQGYAMGIIAMPDATSLSRTNQFTTKVVKTILENPGIEKVMSYTGYDMVSSGVRPSSGTFWIAFKDWSLRKTPDLGVDGIIGDIFARTAAYTEGLVIVFNMPAIMGMGTSGGIEFFLQDRTSEADSKQLSAMIGKLVGELQKVKQSNSEMPVFSSVSTQFRASTPQIYFELNREKARAHNVLISSAYNALQTTYGEYYVNDFNKYGRTYKVKVQADSPYRATPEGLGKIYAQSNDGSMVPMSALIDVTYKTAPQITGRFNGFSAAKILATADSSVGMSDAMATIERVAQEALPKEYTVAWTGTAYQQKETTSASIIAIGFGIVMVFLILAAQYENWSLPLSVLMTVPFAAFGALLGALVRGLPNDIYFQIGMITLVGLSAKNAILIVEFAELSRKAGKSTIEAVKEAARLRLRPILMTSFAFIFGVLPLAISTGAGANSRHSIGTGVVSGMTMATFVGVIFIPLFYKLIMDRSFLVKKKEETTPTGAYKL